MAFVGTCTVKLVEDQEARKTVTGTPLKVTLPGAVPKFEPRMVTKEPAGPLPVERLLIVGGPVTRKANPAPAGPEESATRTE